MKNLIIIIVIILQQYLDKNIQVLQSIQIQNKMFQLLFLLGGKLVLYEMVYFIKQSL